MPSPIPSADALIDSNVIVAALAEEHQDHGSSAALFQKAAPGQFAISAHSFAEAFNTLTKRSGGGFRRDPLHAWAALDRVRGRTLLVGLTPAQTLDAVRRYAEAGGVGPRLYDRLIGEAALRAGIRRLVTWNVAHMRGLFPELEVAAPGWGVRPG